MWKIDYYKSRLTLDPTHAKFDLLCQVVDTLRTVAEEEGYENLEGWLKADDFDPDILLDHGAEHERNKRHHNYFWRLETPGHRAFTVGLSFEKKGKDQRFTFNVRHWYQGGEG